MKQVHDIDDLDLALALRRLADAVDVPPIDPVTYVAVPLLRGLFGPAVLEPIRLHVDAKRYLCATRADYYGRLSEDSKRSLELQGGVFSAAEAERFIRQPHAAEAVKVRLWDDAAKARGAATPGLDHFVPLLREACLSK